MLVGDDLMSLSKSDHESNQIEAFNCRWINFVEMSTKMKDGLAPTPNVRVFSIMSLLKSKLN